MSGIWCAYSLCHIIIQLARAKMTPKRIILSLLVVGIAAVWFLNLRSRIRSNSEITYLIESSSGVFVCEPRGAHYFVSRVLRYRENQAGALKVNVGQEVILNRMRRNLDAGRDWPEVVVFVGSGSIIANGQQMPNLSEIPIVDGKLISYSLSIDDLAQRLNESKRQP